MNPAMRFGVALSFVGFAFFAGTLFGGGGVAKSEQFRVIGEVMSGRQGPLRRRAMAAGLALMALGALIAFAGIAAHDAGRPARCQAYCTAHGYPQSELGPAELTSSTGRRVRVFACHCSRSDGARAQVPANDL